MPKYEPLSKQEVTKAITFDSPSRIPLAFTRWWGEGLWEQYGDRLCAYDEAYPEDVCVIDCPMPADLPCENGFFWRFAPEKWHQGAGLDSNALLPDWEDLKRLEENPPDTDAPHLFDAVKETAERAHKEGRYLLLRQWGMMFERIWAMRGMENLLLDYYEFPEEVHRLHKLVADMQIKMLRRAAREVQPDGFFHSDDLGCQRSLLMSPEHFRAFIKPYYQQIWGTAHELGMHVWLHTCGHVTEIIGDLIESGLNVLHPIQKHTMDWEQVARDWKGKIAFWVGMDVQDTLQTATPEEVRAEVRRMADIFGSPSGGMLFASGNGIVSGTPYENIGAFLEECYRYGTLYCRQ